MSENCLIHRRLGPPPWYPYRSQEEADKARDRFVSQMVMEIERRKQNLKEIAMSEVATKTRPFRVLGQGAGCPNCQHGDQFDILGADGSAQSQSWGDAEEAQNVCDAMNDAYEMGRADYAKEVLQLLRSKEEAEQTEVEPPAEPDAINKVCIDSAADDMPF